MDLAVLHHHITPALYALFIWWFSTGVILYLDGLPRSTFRWSMAGASVLLGVALWGLYATRNDMSWAGAFCAFSSALLAWAWIETAFLLGYVVGPQSARRPVSPSAGTLRRATQAIHALLWHEVAILTLAVIVYALVRTGTNDIGLWTFLVLWWMRASAKLNLFFGVRNLNEGLLPAHLAFLSGFMKRRSINVLFPISISVSTIIFALLMAAALAPDATPYQSAGYTFLATMMGLAILEHWFMVLPLPAEKLWDWGLRSREANANQRSDETPPNVLPHKTCGSLPLKGSYD